MYACMTVSVIICVVRKLNFKTPSCILELLSLSLHVWPNVLHDIVAHLYVCVHVKKEKGE